MLSISTAMTAGGALNYHLGHDPTEYYLNELAQAGRWAGKAAGQLKLPQTVTRRVFQHLLAGFSPDGHHPWVQNAGAAQRDAAWDLTFSAPKSVSVLWALSPKETRAAIEQAQTQAVQAALTFVEDVAGLTRRGKGGAIKEHADVLFATFFHGDSRAHDPAVHTHAVLINLALRKDGTTGALRTLEVFQCKMRAGELYRRTLAQALTQRLKLTLDPEKVGFHVRGVPKDLCAAFSQRSRAIRKAMQQRGFEGAVAAKVVALLTRPKKERLTPQEFFTRCESVGREFGWGQREAQQLVERAAQEQPIPKTRSGQATRTTETHRQPTPAADPSQAPPASPEREAPSRGQDHDRSRGHGTAAEAAQHDPAHDQRGSGRDRTAAEEFSQSAGDAEAHAQRGQGSARGAEQERREEERRSRDERTASAESDRRRTEGQERSERRQQSAQQAQQADWGQATPAPESPPAGAEFKSRNYDLRIAWRRLFPKAPFWSLAQFAKVPVIVFPKAQPRWAKVIWEYDLKVVALRVQRRRLFPDAPKWSPIQGFKLPALRVVRPTDASPEQPQPKENSSQREEIPALRPTSKESTWTRAPQPSRSRQQHEQAQQRMQRTY